MNRIGFHANYKFVTQIFSVISSVASGILFSHFSTVECISKGCGFLLWHHSCSKKSSSREGKFNDIRRKLLYGHNTLDCRKRAKRMSDTTVKTTFSVQNCSKKLTYVAKTNCSQIKNPQKQSSDLFIFTNFFCSYRNRRGWTADKEYAFMFITKII